MANVPFVSPESLMVKYENVLMPRPHKVLNVKPQERIQDF